MARPTLKSFKKAAMKRQGVAEEYQDLSPAYEIRKKLIALRQEAGLTQEQVAERLHTSKGNISRLESVNSNISPKLSTLADYAAAIGYRLRIDFIPERPSRS
jgi:transcriptional regulator with XRE-family HTH domain